MVVYQRVVVLAALLLTTQIFVTHWHWGVLVRIVLPATLLLCSCVLWVNRRYLASWCISVGLVANLLVVVCNGGLMPIERTTLISAVGQEQADQHSVGYWLPGSRNVLVADGKGNFLFLGDQIIITLPFGELGFVVSPGDIVVLSGFAIFWLEFSYHLVRKQRVRV